MPYEFTSVDFFGDEHKGDKYLQVAWHSRLSLTQASSRCIWTC